MRRSTWFTVVVALITGCGDPFTVGIPADPDAADGGPCCDGSGVDSGDETSPPGDDASDTGHPHDSGGPDTNPVADSGPDATDAGCGPCPDSGPDATPDSGGTDAGAEASVDSGTDSGAIDSGSLDSGADSGSVDSGAVDSGSDAGSDSGPSDAGSDAALDSGDAGSVCATPGTYSCASNGVSPLVCSAGHVWISAGGDCNYGCPTADGGTGLCTCSAPPGRLTVTNVNYGVGGWEYTLNDSVTGYKFVKLKGCSNLSTCSSLCVTDFSGTLATITQVQTVLSEQTPATECNTPDTDSIIEAPSPGGFGAITVITDYSSCGGLNTNYLNLNDGTIVCGSGGEAWCKVP